MKSVRKSTYERGQAIVLIAAMMIGMIAIVGLAVDGGNAYFLNRDLQNAVDDAVIAATYAKCVGGNVITAGENAAEDNGFVNNGTDTWVDVVPAPNDISPKSGTTYDDYIRVTITAERPTYFMQVVRGTDTVKVAATGVGFCKESTENTSARALFAGCEGKGDGLKVVGSSNKIVGGIHSNSSAGTSPSTTIEGDASVSGDAGNNMKGTANGETLPGGADENVKEKPYPFMWNLEDFDKPTAKYPARIIDRWGNDPGQLHYGTHSGALAVSSGTIHESLMAMGYADPRSEPVLIYVDGDLRVKGTEPDTPTTFYITFVVTGQIDILGNEKGVTYVNAGESPAGNWGYEDSVNGMDFLLFYSAKEGGTYSKPNCNPSGPATVNLAGNDYLWRGIIYVPTGDVNISASSSGTNYGAIWAYTVTYQTSNMTIEFDSSWLPPDPPTIGIAD